MTRLSYLIAFHALFTALQVYLISKISTIGKIGIALFYHQYRIFRSPTNTYLLAFGIQLAVIVALYFASKRSSRRNLTLACVAVIVLALVGLLYTYNDFMYTYSHRLLKERFHLGFYLFWIGLIVSAIFFLTQKKLSPATGAHQQQPETNE